MFFIDVGKLDYIKVSSQGLFKVGEVGAPEEYKAVTSPIKVKLDKDVIVLFIADAITTDLAKSITFDTLYSTKRKFKDEYVKQLLMSKCNFIPAKKMIKFKHE